MATTETLDSANTRTGLVRLRPDGTKEPLTTGDDSLPSGATQGLITFNRGGGLYALSLNAASTVTGRFTSPFPALLRATLYYRCGSTTTVVAVGLVPTVSGSTATFRTRFDPSIDCGTASGQLFFAATNGTPTVSAILAIFGLGLPAFVLIKAFTPGYFAREDTRTPMIFAAISVAVNIGSPSLATSQFAVLVSCRSNFQTLPFRSPA